MNISDKLRSLRVVIVTHEYATGPSHALERYLQGKTMKLAFIAHPFVFSKERRSHMRVYKNNVQEPEKFFSWFTQIQAINLFKDIILTFWWCLRTGPADLYIGVDTFNAGVGIVLQKLGWVKKTVFYTIDYIPKRFNNPFLNFVYHSLDAFAVKNVDIVWNLSSIMNDERVKVGQEKEMLRKKQVIVPVGTDMLRHRKSIGRFKPYTLAHMGHLTRKQGVQLVIEAIPRIITKLPRFHFSVIGGGPMERELKNLASNLKVSKYITFYGYIKDHMRVEELLAPHAAAIAPYVDSEDNFVRYTDPGKVKAYLAVGLPIIITKVPDIWREIVNNNAGVATTDMPEALGEHIIDVLSYKKNKLDILRKNAFKMGIKYSWTKIFNRAFKRTL